MAEKSNVWLERFKREIGIKSSIILSGNTSDIMLNLRDGGTYQPVLDVIISELRDKGYEWIVKWDRIDGIDKNVSDNVHIELSDSSPYESEYDIDIDDLNGDQGNCYSSPEEFFPYLLEIIRKGTKKTAIILDYSDYIFGNANALSEQERHYMTVLGKALDKSKSYNMLSEKFSEIGNIVIVVTKNNSTIPPSYYLNNPLVSTINVPLPGRPERRKYVETNQICLRISQNLDQNTVQRDDFIDSLDGFTLKEIAQIMKLSRQLDEEMSYEKLINLYKYGEKISPWEELSKEKLATIEETLQERVKGQDTAIKKIKDVIIRAYTGLSGLQHSSKQKKPKGTLFFVGPTGVGKTELAKALAEFVFGDENACIRFDMSEYNHEHSDQRLVGAPPGYVGYEAGGQLTNAVKEKPFCVLLFDEIEKAHGRILDKFLQILEDGRLTDGKGETVYFSETIIIFTSNIGAAEVDPNMDAKDVKKYFIEKVQEKFVKELQRPELLNRIGDNIVAFNFIENSDVFIEIAKIKFKTVQDFVKERYHAALEFENEQQAFSAIAKQAGKANGGRGLLNVIETAIVNKLAEAIFAWSDIMAGRKIIIRPAIPERTDLALFDFDLV